MSKTQKELAFLRELEVETAWTQRFTDFVDKKIKLTNEENILYINSGTGNHVIALRENLDGDSKFYAVAENEDVLNIARDKAAAVRASIDFSTGDFQDESFDAVFADASFVRPKNLENFFNEAVRVAESKGKLILFTPTAGSFGEIFSFLWEIFFKDDLGEHGAVTETFINEIPTVSHLEEIARAAGLKKIETQTSIEIFEFKDGKEFIDAPLVADFLLPVWLESLNEKQKKQVRKELTELVDAEDGNLSFRFTVKATLITGEKN